MRFGASWAAAGVGTGVAAYATYAAVAWCRYGHAQRHAADENQAFLDRFMPEYEVRERHHIHVAAPVKLAFAAARDLDLNRSAIIRSIFKSRELILRARPGSLSLPASLLAQTRALGWCVLAEIPGREIVMGAATRPWKADVQFRALPPDEFSDFSEPGYVKIIWTLGAQSRGASKSLAHTETRAVATDPESRARFRRYWSLLSPGIVLIRRVGLRLVKQDAEHRYLHRYSLRGGI